MDTPERIVFRSSFFALWRWFTVFTSILCAFTVGLTWLLGQPTSIPPTIGLSLIVCIVFVVAIMICPLYLVPEGVHGYNFWGKYRTVKWDEMGTIQPMNLFGLRYLIITGTSDGAKIWLPMYLSEMNEFIAGVNDRAGPKHALVEAIEKYRG